MNPTRLWLQFVRLALVCALGPGFGLAVWMTGAWALGVPRGLWYLTAIQTHSVALLMGWGGAMILGVGLHFLPRLRGVKLFRPAWAGLLFWGLTLGLGGRIAGQLLLATLDVPVSNSLIDWLNMAVAGGVTLQTVSVISLLILLAITFRAGRPLKENEGFRQILPLLAVAGGALGLAQLAWCGGVMQNLMTKQSLALLPTAPSGMAADLMLCGFVPAVSLAMSARLFPLTFRTRLANSRGLFVAAGLLAIGIILSLLETRLSASLAGWAAVFQAAGLLCGTFSVRIFHSRKPTSRTTTANRIRRDPAAVGVVTAYIWASVAAIFLLLQALPAAGLPIPVQLTESNLSRHAIGVGFMTLLIVSVGWKMLPGFAGRQPHGRGLLWCTVFSGSLTAFLRILPALQAADSRVAGSWSEPLFPVAGLAGLATLLAFALALHRSFHSTKTRPS